MLTEILQISDSSDLFGGQFTYLRIDPLSAGVCLSRRFVIVGVDETAVDVLPWQLNSG